MGVVPIFSLLPHNFFLEFPFFDEIRRGGQRIRVIFGVTGKIAHSVRLHFTVTQVIDLTRKINLIK